MMRASRRLIAMTIVRGYMWFHLSATQRNLLAAENLTMLAERVNPAQIAEAEYLAGEFMEKHAKN